MYTDESQLPAIARIYANQLTKKNATRTFDTVVDIQKENVAIVLCFRGKESYINEPYYFAFVIIEGYTTFDRVPDDMKQDVANELVEQGYSNLITDTEYIQAV